VTPITDVFAQDDDFIRWHTHLEDIGAPTFTVALPSGQDLLDTLRYLEIPEEDVPHVLQLAPSPSSEPDMW
jgi:hypothetical protein